MLHCFKNAALKSLFFFFWRDSQIHLHVLPVLKDTSKCAVQPAEMGGTHSWCLWLKGNWREVQKNPAPRLSSPHLSDSLVPSVREGQIFVSENQERR